MYSAAFPKWKEIEFWRGEKEGTTIYYSLKRKKIVRLPTHTKLDLYSSFPLVKIIQVLNKLLQPFLFGYRTADSPDFLTAANLGGAIEKKKTRLFNPLTSG